MAASSFVRPVLAVLFASAACGDPEELYDADAVQRTIDGGVQVIDGGVGIIDGGVAFVDGGVAFVDGGVVYIDGGVETIDGGVAFIDGGLAYIDGGVETIDGGVRVIDGGLAYIDGGVRTIDGGVETIDGGVRFIDGGVVYIDGGVATCDDGLQNGDEAGVDCGGSSCAPCSCWRHVANQRSYWVCPITGTWAQARGVCLAFGADLASIRDAAEQTAVDTALDDAFNAGATSEAAGWVGGEEPTPGTWTWSDGSPMAYTNWAFGEPNNGGSSGVPEDCMTNCTALGAVTACGVAGWGDSRCDTTYSTLVCAD
ncbi:MAG: C-type lectin domain-containing protein [Deltaproteobacteria bacterium]